MDTVKHDRILYYENLSHNAIKALNPKQTFVLATMSPLEVHGPHLPVGQDYFSAFAIAQTTAVRLVDIYPEWTFVLLPIYPIAADCVPQIGSVGFPPRVVEDVAYYLLEPFARMGIARLGISSFHGGPRHICALERAATRLSEKYDVAVASLFSMVLSQVAEGSFVYECIKENPERKIELEQLKHDLHAGFLETSIGLAYWPELVEKGWENLPISTAEELGSEDTNESYLYGYEGKATITQKVRRQLTSVKGILRALRHFKQSTYYGYPALSSASQGKDIFEHLGAIAEKAAGEFIDKGLSMEVHSPLWKLRNVLLNPGVNTVVDKLMVPTEG